MQTATMDRRRCECFCHRGGRVIHCMACCDVPYVSRAARPRKAFAELFANKKVAGPRLQNGREPKESGE
jgi:hypothetical protein